MYTMVISILVDCRIFKVAAKNNSELSSSDYLSGNARIYCDRNYQLKQSRLFSRTQRKMFFFCQVIRGIIYILYN